MRFYNQKTAKLLTQHCGKRKAQENPMIYQGREEHLKMLVAGLEKTGVPLIQYDGTQLLPASMGDDIGIFILIPKLSLLFGIDPLTMVTLFFTTLCIITTTLSIAGFCKLFSSWQARLATIIGVILLARLALTSMDVYCAPAMLTLAVTPWALYYLRRSPSFGSYLFLVCAGAGCVLSHYIRGHSGTASIIFMLVLLVTNMETSRKEKLFSIGCLCLGASGMYLFFYKCLVHYHTFIHTHLPQYEWVQVKHPFWHTVYAGLGFISNNLGLSFSDKSSVDKVMSIKPSLMTPQIGPSYTPFNNQEFETIIRNEVFAILKTNPFYVVRVMVAKVGLLIFYLMLFANFGLMYLSKLPVATLAAFSLAFAWNALPGLLAIPNFIYLTGYTTLAGMLGIYCVASALERDPRALRNLLRGWPKGRDRLVRILGWRSSIRQDEETSL